MIVACRPQVPTETAAHATAQQALTKISIGGQSAGSIAAYSGGAPSLRMFVLPLVRKQPSL